MLNWLANMIGKVGIGVHSLFPYPAEPTHCAQYDDVNYCYYQGSPDNHRVIYFMHGFSYDQTAWTTNFIAGHVEEDWHDDGLKDRPHIITISRGVWWYTDVAHGELLNRFVEGVESLLFYFKTDRVLYGESMGGHNALRWTTDFPGMFSRLALSCPAIPKYFMKVQPPWNGYARWELMAELLISGNYEESTRPDYNILDYTSSSPYPGKVYVVLSENDEFGFYEGGQELVESLKANPWIALESETQAVRHCRPDTENLARFLLN